MRRMSRCGSTVKKDLVTNMNYKSTCTLKLSTINPILNQTCVILHINALSTGIIDFSSMKDE